MKKGSALIGVLLLLVGMLIIGISLNSAVLSTTINTKRAYRSVSALSYAEAGINKALWELNKAGSTYNGESNNTSLSGGSFDVVMTTISGNVKQITSTGYVPNKAKYLSKKVIRAKVSDKPSTTGVAFNYGIQAGGLGITMSNNAKILGNVYAGGTISGANGASVTGGKIQSLAVSGNAKAHTITGSNISKDAWFQTLTSTTVEGTQHPNSPDPVNQNLPISDTTIAGWEVTAVAGGTYSGNMNLSGNTSLGPKKIDGNLTATNGTILTITGTIWVTGNINLANNMIVKLDPGYKSNSGLIISDSQTDKANYGKINISNNVQVQGSGSANSYIMLLSTNNSSTLSNPAINVSNNSTAVVYYATTGVLEVSNNAKIRAITGGGLHLSNGSQVQYDSGLASAEFSGGPGGSWAITEWQTLH
jgi:Tfp pilus assembly protein PilX